MKPSAETEAQGLKAYEQARAFERLRTWRLQTGYLVFVGLAVANAAANWELGHPLLAEASLVVAVFLVVVSWLHWQRLQLRYRVNSLLLTELKEKYGDELPWIQMEKHFAALEELKRELEEEQRSEDGPGA